MSSHVFPTTKWTRRNFTLTQRPQHVQQWSLASNSNDGLCMLPTEGPAFQEPTPLREPQWHSGKLADTPVQEQAHGQLNDESPVHRSTSKQAPANANWLAFMAYTGAHPHQTPAAAEHALHCPPMQKPQSVPFLQTPTPLTPASPASSSMRKASSEISSTTVYDVSAIYMVPLCASNFFLMVGSSAVFLSSLYAMFEPSPSSKPSSAPPTTWLVTLLFNLEIVLMVASGSLFLTASLGLLGALRENVCLLKVYKNILMFFIVLVLGAALLVAGIPWLAHSFVMDHVTEEFVVHYRDKADYKKTIDYLQASLQCCGMTQAGYRDWQANVYFACNDSNPSAERCSVPPSCCRHAPDHRTGRRAAEKVQRKDVYPPVPSTLCGRGVLRMTDREAWKVIHLRGCGDAIFQTLRAHHLELLLVMMLLVAYLLLLDSLAISVQSQIVSLTRIYDKYYKTVYRGQKSMMNAYERRLNYEKARCEGALPANTAQCTAALASGADGRLRSGQLPWR
ncbi:hypothetical protein HPB50_026764 [Hyalomma asiaticum]|uniref:Uncharacterized protein n=1 Tax=Hyalomma asiaticum TaxID=266040 RepID=A0ACB7RXA0_HYAAI|nr:hypothetical protein HPB50_026764 [Hyalomma asiaticum]